MRRNVGVTDLASLASECSLLRAIFRKALGSGGIGGMSRF